MTRRIDPEERKEPITIKLKKKLIDRIKRIENYNPKIESLIEKNIDDLEKK